MNPVLSVSYTSAGTQTDYPDCSYSVNGAYCRIDGKRKIGGGDCQTLTEIRTVYLRLIGDNGKDAEFPKSQTIERNGPRICDYL